MRKNTLVLLVLIMMFFLLLSCSNETEVENSTIINTDSRLINSEPTEASTIEEQTETSTIEEQTETSTIEEQAETSTNQQENQFTSDDIKAFAVELLTKLEYRSEPENALNVLLSNKPIFEYLLCNEEIPYEFRIDMTEYVDVFSLPSNSTNCEVYFLYHYEVIQMVIKYTYTTEDDKVINVKEVYNVGLDNLDESKDYYESKESSYIYFFYSLFHNDNRIQRGYFYSIPYLDFVDLAE